MIKMLSQQISQYLVAHGSDESEEVLSYGAECFLNELISNALLLMIGIATNHVWELLVWSISFGLLRVNLGGIHAPNHAACLLGGTLVGAASLIISPFLLHHIALTGGLTAAAVITASVIAPVPHKNKQHVQTKKEAIKRKTSILAVLECIIALLLYCLSPAIASYVISGLIMATALGLAGFLWNPR